MKVAVSTLGKDLSFQVDPRFGRAATFVIYDTDQSTFFLMDNIKNLNAAQGAGIQTAQNVAASGAEAVITGHTGPKAFRVLEAAKISIFYGGESTVGEALEALKAGTLKQIESPDVEGHW